MKVSDLIDWLRVQDYNADIEVTCKVKGNAVGGDSFIKASFNKRQIEYLDAANGPYKIIPLYELAKTLITKKDD